MHYVYLSIIGNRLIEQHHDDLLKMAVGIAVTVPCAVLGCYLVLRRLSMLGDAISHGVLPGIVLAVLLSGQLTGGWVIAGAMLFGLMTAVLTQAVHSIADVPEDSSMGVVFTGLFALGMVMIALWQSHAHLDVDCVLFGKFELIPVNMFDFYGLEIPRPMPTMLVMLFGTIIFVALFWKELKIVSFDPDLATSMGLKAIVIHYLLMAMVAGVTVTAFEAVGSVLVIAMLIVPAASAHLLTNRLSWMLVWASLIAILSVVLSVILASEHVLNNNTAGMMAVVAGAIFALTVFLAPRHGIAAKVARNIRLGVRIIAEDILAALYRREEAAELNDAAQVTQLQTAVRAAAKGLKGRLAVFFLRRQRQLLFSATGDMSLTRLGRQRAEALVRAHRLWEAWLDQNLDLAPDHLHDPAMRMEHFIGPALREKLADELHEPDIDPHGKAIPRTEKNKD